MPRATPSAQARGRGRAADAAERDAAPAPPSRTCSPPSRRRGGRRSSSRPIRAATSGLRRPAASTGAPRPGRPAAWRPAGSPRSAGRPRAPGRPSGHQPADGGADRSRPPRPDDVRDARRPSGPAAPRPPARRCRRRRPRRPVPAATTLAKPRPMPASIAVPAPGPITSRPSCAARLLERDLVLDGHVVAEQQHVQARGQRLVRLERGVVAGHRDDRDVAPAARASASSSVRGGRSAASARLAGAANDRRGPPASSAASRVLRPRPHREDEVVGAGARPGRRVKPSPRASPGSPGSPSPRPPSPRRRRRASPGCRRAGRPSRCRCPRCTRTIAVCGRHARARATIRVPMRSRGGCRGVQEGPARRQW